MENKFEGINNKCRVAVPIAKIKDDLMVVLMRGVAVEMEINMKKNWRLIQMEIEERAMSRMIIRFGP